MLDPAPLRQRLEAARAFVRDRHAAGASGHELVRGNSDRLDGIVRELFASLVGPAPEGLCLVALGGWGRRELAPRSDLDLLLLHEGDAARAQAVAEPLFKALWDLSLEPAAAARTVEEADAVARAEHTARTALLECRFLAGDVALFGRLETIAFRGLTSRQVDELVEQKRDELTRRRERFGGAVHLLEPNVKSSPGGLRDLQTALWVARARFQAAGLTQLLQRGLVGPREAARIRAARDLLWRIRVTLHLGGARKEEALSFDRQERVAEALGYVVSGDVKAGVERFMRDYYLAADAIGRFADDLLERCQPEPAPSRPGDEPRAPRSVGAGLEVWRGRVTLGGQAALAADPSLFVRAFTCAASLGLPLQSWSLAQLREAAERIDDEARGDPRVVAALREALARCGRAEWARAMHRAGVLGALLPECGRTTALHQHDAYHVYTVDTHLLFALQRLGALFEGELLELEPRVTNVARELGRSLPLALGVLFHDAGKGLGGDHSRTGEALVRGVAARLGLAEEEIAEAGFLVAEHLAMSHVSQRRDLSDPALIEAFAQRVGSPRRLRLLFVLTYVDIASVGPTTWNEWKRRLLVELYDRTAAWFAGRDPHEGAAPHEEALRRRGYPEDRLRNFLARLPPRYRSFAAPADAPRALRVLEQAGRRPLAAALHDLPAESTSVVIIACADRPGLLAAIAGVLTANRIDILSADAFGTRDGLALDFFHVRGPEGGCLPRARFRAARRQLAAVLHGGLDVEALVRRALRPSGLPARPAPPVPTRVKLDSSAAEGQTVIDVIARDRPGLLHAATRAITDAGLSIGVARISTEGHKAIDAFYVSGVSERPADRAALERAIAAAVDALPTP